MCGICGIVDWNQTLSPEVRRERVAAMNQALVHRGPDESGSHSDQLASLAMRRLAIIDCKTGQQPIFNEAGDIAIFYNGEVYNFQSLREQLLAKGHTFRTASDTEVLVHLYEDHGTEMLSMLKGMFSFCLYDLRQKIFLLARDRFGEKPLYYHWDQGIFSFSSEIKSLLENKIIPRKLNTAALPYYFRTSLVPEPLTLLNKVYSLPPGHYLRLRQGKLEKQSWFQPAYKTRPALKTEQEAIEFIRPLLVQAVKRQMVSDVPLGAFLSGGIDSSTIVALLQKNSSKKIKTFNVRFEDQEYDESAIARKVAEYCQTEHHEILIPNVDFDESIFWNIIEQVGLPFRDSSAIPTWMIAREISGHVKVALSGDGGDEVFGGYELFQWYQRIVGLQKVARPIRSIANSSLGILQSFPGLGKQAVLRQIKRGLQTSLESRSTIPIALNEMFDQQSILELFNGSAKSIFPSGLAEYPLLTAYPVEAEQWSDLRKIMYYRLVHTLPANMLVKVDRMSMAHSLEVRAPFLDADLFEASLEIPDHLLIKQGRGKYLLRKIMEKELPEEVFNHPKTGFNIPLYKYQNEQFRQLARRLLFEENPWPGLIAPERLEAIYARGLAAGKQPGQQSAFRDAHQLWMMMQLFGWAKRFKVQI